MSQRFSHTFTLVRGEAKALRKGSAQSSLEKLLNRAYNGKLRQSGWKLSVKQTMDGEPAEQDGVDVLMYAGEVHAVCTPKRKRDDNVVGAEFQTILDAMSKDGWQVYELNGEEYTPPEPKLGADDVGFADATIPADYAKYFAHIFGRGHQIDSLLRAINAATRSGMKKRYHTVLWGEPAGGKTSITRPLEDMLGRDAVLRYDGTAVSQAGLMKDLKERAEMNLLPIIVVVEEIEKGNEDHWRPLLGLLDERAELRKLTARESYWFKAPMLWIATVNNKTKFDSFLEGALSSRFSNPIWCPRPSDTEIRKILERDLGDGDKRWIEPAIQLAKKHGLNDPRAILRIMDCGADGLLDGSYQKSYEACLPPNERK